MRIQTGHRSAPEHTFGIREFIHQLHSPQQWQRLPQLLPSPVHTAHTPSSIPDELHLTRHQHHQGQAQQQQCWCGAAAERWTLWWKETQGCKEELRDVCAQADICCHGFACKAGGLAGVFGVTTWDIWLSVYELAWWQWCSAFWHRGTVVVCWLLNIPATCKCISGTDLHRLFYMLPHWDRSCSTVYWHRADLSQRWPYSTRCLAG